MTKRKLRRWSAGTAALALGTGVVLGAGPGAQAAPPETLASFAATGTATPFGVLTRAPVETAGGGLFSKTSLQLGKSLALAAGATAGEVGDLFIGSSVPGGEFAANPSVVNAQDPPSSTVPREANLTLGQYGGAQPGEVRNADLSARTSDAPMAVARAAGQAFSAPMFSSGFSTSSSTSTVAPDGTVTSESLSSLQNVAIGEGPAKLTFASIDSIARVVVTPGEKTVPVLQIRMNGGQLGGVPIVVDERGISMNDQIALPFDALASFESGLDSLAEQGLTFRPTPTTRTVTDDGAAVSGAAFTFRYRAPDSLPRPSDIGSDEEFQLGFVAAAATARLRGAPPPGLGSPGAPAPAAPAPAAPPATPVEAPIAAPALGGGSALPAAPVPQAPGAGPTGQSPATVDLVPAPSDDFFLPARVASPLPGEARNGYRFFMLAALGGVAAFVLVLKRAV
ncbi:MAG: hypothetical protein ACT4QF_06245 [Sporichthyaceae bacterium]